MVEIGIFAGGFIPSTDHQLIDYPGHLYQDFAQVGADLGLRFAYLPASWLGIELEGSVIPTTTQGNDDSVLIYSARGHLLFQLPMQVTPFLVGGAGVWGIRSSALGNDSDFDDIYPHWGLGLKYYANQSLAVRFDFRHILGANLKNDAFVNHFEMLLGLSWVIGMEDEVVVPRDSDGDGITDDKDRCPRQASDQPDGCPPKEEPPPVEAPMETPVEAPPATPVEPPKEAPVEAPVETPVEVVKEAPAEPPKEIDTDGDGVPDKDDRCPDVAGLKENQGCLPEAAKKFSGVIKGITFPTGSITIQRAAHPILDGVVKLLNEYPGMHLSIEGHTDSQGRAQTNLELSQGRAESVREYLIGKGIEADRLEAKGFGDKQAVMSNRTAKGRAANRRIEFHITSQ